MTQFERYSEIKIIELIKDGEKSLYEVIVRRFNRYLYKIGRSYNYNHEDTQDLMQETFIDAYKNLNNFEGRSSFKTWIIRIMMNNCYRKRRKSSFKNEILQDVNENATPLFTSSDHETGKVIQNKELGRVIEEALGRIPLEYRIVFSLREITGLSVAETANLLGISETNVKTRLSRSKAMLREKIEKTFSLGELFEFNLIYCDAMVENVMKKINEI